MHARIWPKWLWHNGLRSRIKSASFNVSKKPRNAGRRPRFRGFRVFGELVQEHPKEHLPAVEIRRELALIDSWW